MLQEEQTSETVLRKQFQQLRERYNSYFEAYTDGSKCEHKVAAAAFFTKDPDNPKTTRLRDGSSVFNAELEGILLYLKKFLLYHNLRDLLFIQTACGVRHLKLKMWNAFTTFLKRYHRRPSWS